MIDVYSSYDILTLYVCSLLFCLCMIVMIVFLYKSI